MSIDEAINKAKNTFASIKNGNVKADINTRTATEYLNDVSYNDIEYLLGGTTTGQQRNIRKALNKMFKEHGLSLPAKHVNIEGRKPVNTTLNEVANAYEEYLDNIIAQQGNGIAESTARAFLYQLRKFKIDFDHYERIKGLTLDKVPKAEIERYLAIHASSVSLHNQNVAMFRNMRNVVGDYIPLFENLTQRSRIEKPVVEGQYLTPRELDALLEKIR